VSQIVDEPKRRSENQMQREIESFVSQLKLADSSEYTPKHYEYILGMFRRSLGEDKEVKDIQRENIVTFFEWLGKPSEERLHKKAYKRASVMNVKACLSSFFQYMIDTGRLMISPMPKLARMERPSRSPIWLSEDEKDRLLKAARKPKDKLLLNLLISTGMRLGELRGIRVKNVDFEGGRIRVKLKRGAIREYIIVPALVHDNVPRLIKNRIKDKNLGPDDLLIGLSQRGIQYTIGILAKRANINKPLSPHKLRHTFAVLLRKRGVHTADLQNLLHHKDRATTAIYEAVDMKDTEDELIRLNLVKRGKGKRPKT
jgi:integrase/recombinase XerD